MRMSDPQARARPRRAGLPGVWRLRLPLPWPGVPHCNAWAVAAGDGIVLFDTGMHEPGSLAHLERALAQVQPAASRTSGSSSARTRTPTTTARPPTIVDARGLRAVDAPQPRAHDARRAGPRRRARAPARGRAPERRARGAAARATPRRARGQGFGIAGIDRARPRRCCPASRSTPTSARWAVYETPGHAPSHVCLFQPERRLLISGDHLLGRVSLYYDYGYSPDPAGEFLHSLDVVEQLDARLCLSGHGRTFTDVQAHIEANRALVHERIAKVHAVARARADHRLRRGPARLRRGDHAAERATGG